MNCKDAGSFGRRLAKPLSMPLLKVNSGDRQQMLITGAKLKITLIGIAASLDAEKEQPKHLIRGAQICGRRLCADF